MKNRYGFVTNSSSSSFIIRNKTDRFVTSREVAEELTADLLDRNYASGIIEDADGRFEITPHGEIEIECGDHPSDGAFECFIHDDAGWAFGTNSFGVRLKESHH